MKYIVFLMLAACVGCSGQSKDQPLVHGDGCDHFGELAICPSITPGPMVDHDMERPMEKTRPFMQAVPAVNCFYGQSNGYCYSDPSPGSPLPFYTHASEAGKTDRFSNCVTFEGIHYCPEGRYVQIQDDAKRPYPYGICASYPMLDGCKVPDFKHAPSIVCPSYAYCGTTAPTQPGGTIATPFGSELDQNTHIPNDNSHLDLNS